MTDQQKKTLVFLALGGIAVYALTRKPTAVKTGTKPGTMTNVQLAEAYKSMMSTPVRYYYDSTDENDPSTGTAWAIDLARHTRNYESVKNLYKQYYEGDLSEDLISWFSGIELSQYVNALWTQSGQAMS